MEVEKNDISEALIEQCRKGDKNAFDQLVKVHGTALYNFILLMTKSKSLADDVCQETWTCVYNHLDEYREQGQFKCWLFKIANNQCLNHLRFFKRMFVPLTEIMNIENEKGTVFHISISNPMPDEELERKESLKLIIDLIKDLPVKQRQVFLLKMHSDLTFKQIALILSRPLNTVLTQMRTALLTIRKKLKEIYGDMQI